MYFDNQKTTIKVFLWKMFIAIFFAVLIVFFLAAERLNKSFLGFDRYELAIGAVFLYIFIILIINILGLNYIYFNDDTDQIIIRYYPMRPLGRKKKAVQIPKISLAGFKLKKSIFGLKKYLLLQQRTKKGVAKYPPIGITALTKAELEMLQRQLSKYVRP